MPSILAQPKRIALLAYLGVDGSGGFVARERVMSVLWPESDEARARQSLRNALYRVRQSLGEGVVVNRGAGDIGIEAEWLTLDVADFRAAVAGRRFEDAAALYGGMFLPAFHLDDNPEFEEWTSRVRTALHGDALWAFREAARSREREGDVEGARSLLRRAQDLAPRDEEIVRQRLRLLEACGNRTAALAEGREWIEMLGSTLGVRPSEETLRLVDELEASSNRDLGATGAAPGPSDSRAVAVTASAGSTLPAVPREPVLTAGADRPSARPIPVRRSGARWRVLAGWILGPAALVAASWALADRAVPLPPADRGVLVERFDVDRAAGGPAAGLAMGALTARLLESGEAAVVLPRDGVDAAARDGIERRLVSGRIRRDGDGLAGEVTLATTASPDEVLVRATAEVDRYDLESLAVRLVDALEAGSGQPLSAGGVVPALTASPSAVLPFYEGELHAERGSRPEAIAAYREALSRDSTFPMAEFRLSIVLSGVGERQASTDASDRAVALSGRMTAQERRLLDAWRVHLAGNVEQALPLFESLAASRVPDPEVWQTLGEIRFHWGPQLGVPRLAADSAFSTLLSIRPDDVNALEHRLRLMGPEATAADIDRVGQRLADLGAPPEVVTEARAISTLSRRVPLDSSFASWAVAGAFNQESRRLTQLAASARVPSDLVPFLRTLPLASEPRREVLRSLLIAQVLAASGRMGEARSELAELGVRYPDRALEYRILLELSSPMQPSAAVLGDLRDALRAAPAVGKRDWVVMVRAPEPGIFTPRALVLDAMLTRRLGESIDSAGIVDRGRAVPVPFDVDYWRQVLAEIHGGAGRHERVLGVLGPGRPQWHRIRPDPMSYLVGTSRWARIESLMALGREDEAIRWLETFPDVGGYDLLYLPRASLLRARMLERQGREAEASAAYARAAELWEGADPEFSHLLREALDGAKRTKRAGGR